MKRNALVLPVLFCLWMLLCHAAASADETRIAPAYQVPDYVEHLLEIASGEIGYTENHGISKYGEWAGDPAAQWCAEFQCWCVDQVDQRWGTSLLRNVYPFYTSSNTGRSWFVREGRYVVRKGQVENWGYQWLTGQNHYVRSGDYLPQPGDWVFFNWTGGEDTEHVALVEYCTRDTVTGKVLIHVIEGNNPSAVERKEYDLQSNAILGYGTVRDVAGITMRFGNEGIKVRQLQEKLSYLRFFDSKLISGHYGDATTEAVRAYQTARGLRANGIATMNTQLTLDEEYDRLYGSDPDIWTVRDDD